MGHPVAVKTMRIPAQKDLQKIRKVTVNAIFGLGPSQQFFLAILQGSRSLVHATPSKRLETRWGSGGHEETTIRHCFRMDGAWNHHGIYRKSSHQSTGTGTLPRFARHFLHLTAAIVARGS